MNERLKINIKIADSKYPMVVKPEEERIIRDAAALVDKILSQYSRKYSGAELSKEHMLIFTAVDIAVRFLKQDADSNAALAGEEIENITAELRQYLAQNL